jgi:1-aminocyclopropane-1-carboxylate deaminase
MQTDDSILQELHDDAWAARRIRVFVKRDDLIDPEISGNKWRKLKYHIELCRARRQDGLLTFGGAYSNHLVATAAAAYRFGLSSVGIVRGDELHPESNDTLRRCRQLGMQLRFVSREMYHLRQDKMYQQELLDEFPGYLLVPEGGASYYGMIGCQEIWKEIDQPIDQVWVAAGTCTTACGLAMGLSAQQRLHVVPVLKGYEAEREMQTLFLSSGMEASWVEEVMGKTRIHPEFHFGGYGKFTDELLHFIRSTHERHGLPLDPVYTGKAFFGLCRELIKTSYTNTNVLFIHTGGIQGARAIEEKTGFPLYP